MDRFGLDNNIIKQLQNIFCKLSEIESVVLYGSMAMGELEKGFG